MSDKDTAPPEIKFRNSILIKLREIYKDTKKKDFVKGPNLFNWKKDLYDFDDRIPRDAFPFLFEKDRGLTQEHLLFLRDKKEIDTKDLCALILIWGNMHLGTTNRNFKIFFHNDKDWLELAEKLRNPNNGISALQGYDEFYKLYKNGKLKGCDVLPNFPPVIS